MDYQFDSKGHQFEKMEVAQPPVYILGVSGLQGPLVGMTVGLLVDWNLSLGLESGFLGCLFDWCLFVCLFVFDKMKHYNGPSQTVLIFS